MPNFNKLMIMGHLTRDPELKYTPGGTAICEFGIATNRKAWKEGQQDEKFFGDVQAWAGAGETIAKHLKKGDPLFVEGRLKTETWQGKDGAQKSRTRIVLEQFQFVGGKNSKPQSEEDVALAEAGLGAPVSPPQDDSIPF